MAEIHYTITLFSDWHCGSGQSSGPDSDKLVKKDKYGLPIIPGRTIKGLLKEAAYDLFKDTDGFSEFVKSCFGSKSDSKDPVSKNVFHYSNANLPAIEINYLKGKPNEISKLYRNIPFNRIMEETGTTDENSLHSMQVTIPLTLNGKIMNIPKAYLSQIEACMKMIKRLGNKRNRGFGRCRFFVDENREGGLL